MRAGYAVLALLLMTLAFAGVLRPVHVFVIASVAGLVRPSDLAMRSALVADTMPPEFAITTKTGGYSLSGVQPGTYKVKFSVGCGDSGFATQWWHGAILAP